MDGEAVVSVNDVDVPPTDPTIVPLRATSYAVTPTLSVEADQETFTDVGDAALAVTADGADGAVVSTVYVYVAGVESVPPLFDAATVNVCVPWARPE